VAMKFLTGSFGEPFLCPPDQWEPSDLGEGRLNCVFQVERACFRLPLRDQASLLDILLGTAALCDTTWLTLELEPELLLMTELFPLDLLHLMRIWAGLSFWLGSLMLRNRLHFAQGSVKFIFGVSLFLYPFFLAVRVMTPLFFFVFRATKVAIALVLFSLAVGTLVICGKRRNSSCHRDGFFLRFFWRSPEEREPPIWQALCGPICSLLPLKIATCALSSLEKLGC